MTYRSNPYTANITDCSMIIQEYILQQKGVNVMIMPPYGERQEKLFIKALNVACAHFNYWIGQE